MKSWLFGSVVLATLAAVPAGAAAEPIFLAQEPSIKSVSGPRYLPGEREKRSTVLNEGNKLQKQADKYMQQQQLDKAIEAYKAAIHLSAVGPERWLGLGEALAAKGRYVESVAACGVPLGKTSLSAYKHLCNVLELEPGYAIDPEHPQEAPVFNATTDGVSYLRFALLLSQLGRFSEAVSMYESGAGFLLAQPDTLVRSGDTFTTPALSDDSPFSLASLRVSPTQLSMKPLQAAAHTLLGKAYWISDPDESVAHCEKAVALQPRFAAAYLQLGYAYDEKQQKAQARAAWEKARQLGRADVAQKAQQALSLRR